LIWGGSKQPAREKATIMTRKGWGAALEKNRKLDRSRTWLTKMEGEEEARGGKVSQSLEGGVRSHHGEGKTEG